MLETVGLSDDVSYRFSQWDPNDSDKYEGTPEQWEEAQDIMGKILDHLGLQYEIGIGEAAFYGPKLDIQIRNVYGKEDTLITIQIDPLLAERFGMEYVDEDGTKKRPYIIHRTSLGCYERTLALLIEKYAGAFPLWLAPEQVKIMPIADRHVEYADKLYQQLRTLNFRCSVDDRAENVKKKIRDAQLEKIPYMLVLGDKEVETNTVSLRYRSGKTETLSVEELLNKLVTERDNRVR
jgi:threonyl-tRNA synthetase